jgi:hypothetical protein
MTPALSTVRRKQSLVGTGACLFGHLIMEGVQDISQTLPDELVKWIPIVVPLMAVFVGAMVLFIGAEVL